MPTLDQQLTALAEIAYLDNGSWSSYLRLARAACEEGLQVMAYRITRVTEEPTLENGKPAAIVRIEFMVGDDGPFFERFAKADFSDYAAQQRLSEFAGRLERLRAGS